MALAASFLNGRAFDKTTGSSLASASVSVSSGERVVVIFGCDPASGTVGATDSLGHTYTVDLDQVSGSGANGARLVMLSAAMTSGGSNVVTVTHPSLDARALDLYKISGGASQPKSGGAYHKIETGSVPDVVVTVTDAVAGEVAIGGVVEENLFSTIDATGTTLTIKVDDSSNYHGTSGQSAATNIRVGSYGFDIDSNQSNKSVVFNGSNSPEVGGVVRYEPVGGGGGGGALTLYVPGVSPAPAAVKNTGSSSNARTTASFTAPAGSRIWAFAGTDNNAQNGVHTFSSSPSLTWTKEIERNTPGAPAAAIAWADAGAGFTGTVSVSSTLVGSFPGSTLYVCVVTGGETTPGGAEVGDSTGSAGNPYLSRANGPGALVATASGSIILGLITDWSGTSFSDGNEQIPQTIIDSLDVGSDYADVFYRVDGTTTASSSYDAGFNEFHGSGFNHVVIEIREGAGGGGPAPRSSWGRVSI